MYVLLPFCVQVIVDVKSPNIVHSVGGDCSVLSYDLKAAKRIICHIANTGIRMYVCMYVCMYGRLFLCKYCMKHVNVPIF